MMNEEKKIHFERRRNDDIVLESIYCAVAGDDDRSDVCVEPVTALTT